MRSLFDKIQAEGEPALQRLVADKLQESVDLDFKIKKDSNSGNAADDDKKNLAKLLSAFSNSMGGLVIWGVDARKNPEGVDCAIALTPISNIEKFKSDIVELVSRVIMTRHEGVHVHHVNSAISGSGYLLVYVERSERRPHRNEIDKKYYKRAGGSCIVMEHFDIEDSFKRFVVPSLELQWSLRQGGNESRGEKLYKIAVIDVILQNPSTVTARYPYLIFENSPSWVWGDTLYGNFNQNEQGKYAYLGGANDVIHPSLSMTVVGLYVRIECSLDDQNIPAITPPLYSRLCSYGCYNSRLTQSTLSIAPEELIKAAFGT
jgi:hypothetical protein